VTYQSHDSLESLVGDLVRELNTLCGDESAAEMPSLSLSLSGFRDEDVILLSSWLHSLYRESARMALEFVSALAGDDPDSDHRADVIVLRTYFQHHLGSSSDDAAKRARAESFVVGGLGSAHNPDWASAHAMLRSRAIEAIARNLGQLRRVADPDLAEVHREVWRFRKARDVRPDTVDPIIRSVVEEVGFDQLDVAAFRKRHIASWQVELRNQATKSDPTEYLRSIVRRDLLRMTANPPMPIGGVDVMDAFGISPGPEVGRVLIEAQRIWESHADKRPSSRTLLAEVADSLGLDPIVPLEID
jgi:hypothetical protein